MNTLKDFFKKVLEKRREIKSYEYLQSVDNSRDDEEVIVDCKGFYSIMLNRSRDSNDEYVYSVSIKYNVEISHSGETNEHEGEVIVHDFLRTELEIHEHALELARQGKEAHEKIILQDLLDKIRVELIRKELFSLVSENMEFKNTFKFKI